MTTTEAPALIHFRDCDDLALGRYVRSVITKLTFADILDRDDVGTLAVEAAAGHSARLLDRHRGACDCARLRAAAIDTQISRIFKARRVARNTGDELAFTRLSQDITRLRDEKSAITAGASS